MVESRVDGAHQMVKEKDVAGGRPTSSHAGSAARAGRAGAGGWRARELPGAARWSREKGGK